jgi:enoyl-CoA hydratase
MTNHYQTFMTSRQERVLTITLNNPPANFVTTIMMIELKSLLVALKNDTEIGAVILTSAVKGVFLTHYDVDEIDQSVATIPFAMSTDLVSALSRSETTISHVPGMRQLLRRTVISGVSDMNLFGEVMALMREMNKVFIAAINGRAMGAGCELALACDFRLMVEGHAEDGVMIGHPEILIGIIPGGCGTQLLTRSLGVAKALEICLEGRPLAPAEAQQIGLINQVVPAGDLLPEAMILAERMSRRSPHAVLSMKQAIYQAASLSLDRGMDMEKNIFMSVVTQSISRRALKAYTVKIRELLASGRQWTIHDYEDLLNGTAIDMTTL